MVWDIKTGECVFKFPDQADINTMAFSPDSDYIAVGGSRDMIELVDIRSGKPQIMSSSMTRGKSWLPLIHPTSTTLDRAEMCVDKKRRLSQSEEPTKVKHVEDTSLVDVEMLAGGIDASGCHPMSACLSQAVSPSQSSQLQELSDIESALHTLKIQRKEYKQPVYIAPMAKSSLRASDDNLFPLMDKVKEFLVGDSLVMLILGDSGAGKSTFNRYLENELWKTYKIGGRIPLFINLPVLKSPEEMLVEKQLKVNNFSEDQIRELKQHRQFILICDGYDESLLTSNLHTTNFLNRPGQWDAKLVITCRSQHLGPDYLGKFAPMMTDRYHRTSNILFQEAAITPFSKDQIEDYVGQYVLLESRKWVEKDYLDRLAAIPSLMDLVKNPFLLSLCLEALPSIVQDKMDLSRLRVTRVQLYDRFVRRWLEVNKCRIYVQVQGLDKETQLAFNNLLDAGFEKYGVEFQVNLAAAIFREQEGRPVVDYIHKKDKNSWKAEFFSPDPEIILLREASVLCRVGTQHRFLHRSMLEYFFSRRIWGPVDHADEFAPQGPSNPSDLTSPISDHPLSQGSIVIEHSIIQFLAERVQLDLNFKKQLENIIELSKTDENAALAAANAITILVKAGVRFNGEDLRGIRIPGADLSGGQFDSALLQEADLTGVNFTRSWIRQANFTGAMMEDVQFGEVPYLKGSEELQGWWGCARLSCAYSPDGKAFVIGFDDGFIKIFDTNTWEETYTYQAHSKRVAYLKYSPCSNKLLSVGDDGTLHLWDCTMNQTEYVVNDLPDLISTVAFSPCGNHFALACVKDKVLLFDTQSGGSEHEVLLFDTQSGGSEHVLGSPKDKSICISYSLDGQHITLVGGTGAIRRINVNQKQIEQVMELKADGLRCVAISLNSQWAALAGRRRLQLLETTTGKQGLSWNTSSDIGEAVFSPDGWSIATACYDLKVSLWSVQTSALLFVFTGHSTHLTNIAFSPHGSQLASCARDGSTRLWDVTLSGTGFDPLQSSQSVAKVDYSPNGRFIRSSRHGETPRLYNASSGESSLFSQGTLHLPRLFGFCHNGHQVVTCDADDTVRIWDIETKECVLAFSNQDHIDTMAISPLGDYIAVGGFRDIIDILDTRSGKVHRTLEDHNRKSGDLTLEQWYALVQEYSDVVKLEGVSSARARKISAQFFSEKTHDNILSLAFSSKGNQIVSGGQDGMVRIWDVETGKWTMLYWNYGKEVTQVEFSPGDTHIAFTHRDNELQLWRKEDTVPQHRLVTENMIYNFAYSSCGKWITTSGERVVQLWRYVPGGTNGNWICVVAIRDFCEFVFTVAWRPKSDTLEFATGCLDGSVRTWRVEEDDARGVTVKQVWGDGLVTLAMTDAIIDNVTGLSAINRKLLLQRGAKNDRVASSDDVLSESKEQN
ncbi:WD_REPEATS_REGION domain-containing protein [Linnemannia zychae]|nr:WD_REPEATS_REGION domain-containing protein [Linnemannia zychae]